MGCSCPCCEGTKMGCCHIYTGAAIVGTVEVVMVMVMLAGSGLMLDRWRHWERLPYDPDWTTTTISTTSVAPTVPYVYKFVKPEQVEVGWIIEVAFTVSGSPTAFHISLECGSKGDKPFHFNPRWGTENHVARNTRRGSVWDTNEEQGGGLPFAASTAYTVRIQVYNDYYEVSINGAVFTRYDHRIDYGCIDTVYVDGSLDATPFNVVYYWYYGNSQENNWFEAWLEFILAHHCAYCAVWLVAMIPYGLAFYSYEPVWVLPNLLMLIVSVLALAFVIAAMMMRMLDPSHRYQTDEIQEAALLYAMIMVWIWWLVCMLFTFLVWRFYKWIAYGEHMEPEKGRRVETRGSWTVDRY